MYYTINKSDEVTLTLNSEDLLSCATLLAFGICSFHDDQRAKEHLPYYRSLRDTVCSAYDELAVYNNPDFMEGDK